MQLYKYIYMHTVVIFATHTLIRKSAKDINANVWFIKGSTRMHYA